MGPGFPHYPETLRTATFRDSVENSESWLRQGGFSVWFLVVGEWIMVTIIGDYIGTTLGIHSPIPY